MINALRSLFSLPLLTKELTERAARPRTYWMRIAAALLLYGGFWINNRSTFVRGAQNTASVLGAGEQMFALTVLFLFMCIGLFVPAMLCGVITQEKERDSLVLLLLTRMRPWQIAVQKYLGGLVPALTLLLLAMPLVAVAYAYGGVTGGQVLRALVLVILSAFQIGAVALWASCSNRTTVAAFFATYIAAGAVLGAPSLFVAIDQEFHLGLINWRPGTGFGLIEAKDSWLFYAHVPPAVFADSVSAWNGFDDSRFYISCLSIITVGSMFLLAAIYQLPRRAFDRPKHMLRRVFAAMDRWTHWLNRKVGGVTFGRRGADLPADLPIVWREKRARALARPEYLVRLLVLIMLFVVPISILLIAGAGDDDGLPAMVAILSGLGLLVLCTTAANGIVNERVNQTFEVLLTTPMSAAEILKQKVRALRPLMVMLVTPILIVCAIEFVMESWMPHSREYDSVPAWLYPVSMLTAAAIYFPMFTWFSVWTGLWCKTRIRAIITTLVAMSVWIVVPIYIAEESGARLNHENRSRYVYLLSPLMVPALTESNDLDDLEPGAPWLPVLANVILYGGALYFIRRHCLTRADSYLRR